MTEEVMPHEKTAVSPAVGRCFWCKAESRTEFYGEVIECSEKILYNGYKRMRKFGDESK